MWRNILISFAWIAIGVGAAATHAGCDRRCTPETKKYMRSWMKRLCAAEKQALDAPSSRWHGLKLPRASRPPMHRLPKGALAVLTPKGVTLKEQKLSPWPARGALVAALKKRRAQGNIERLHLAVTPRVKITRVKRFFEAMVAAGLREVSLLVQPTESPILPTPPDTNTLQKLERFLTKASLAQRQKLLLRRFEGVARKGRCGALEQVMARAAKRPQSARCMSLAKELPRAVESCGCTLDWRRLLTVTYLLFGPYSFVGAWSGTLDPGADGVTLPKQARWQDAVAKILEAPPKPLWLKLE